MIGYIYCVTNLINGKKYIGQHKATQFEPQNYMGSGTLLLKAFEKYGKENFECVLLEECNTTQQLNDQEKYWINYYNAVLDPNYYNLVDGGIGGSGKALSQIVTELWKDNDYRQHHVDALKQKWQDEEYRAKNRNSFMKHLHVWTEDEKTEQSYKSRMAWLNQELRDQQRQHQLTVWTDDKKQIQRLNNLGSNNPSFGKKYMTDGNDNWLYIQPDKAPSNYYSANYIFITDGQVKKRHDKSLPIPEGWTRVVKK